jgi:hypothetical protein
MSTGSAAIRKITFCLMAGFLMITWAGSAHAVARPPSIDLAFQQIGSALSAAAGRNLEPQELEGLARCVRASDWRDADASVARFNETSVVQVTEAIFLYCVGLKGAVFVERASFALCADARAQVFRVSTSGTGLSVGGAAEGFTLLYEGPIGGIRNEFNARGGNTRPLAEILPSALLNLITQTIASTQFQWGWYEGRNAGIVVLAGLAWGPMWESRYGQLRIR